MTTSADRKAAFKARMNEEIRKAREGAVKSDEELKEAVAADFDGIEEPEAGDNQLMFSYLFFDPAEIGEADFPVNVFHHAHGDWPDWVTAMIPEKDPCYVWNKRITYDFVLADDEHGFLVGDPGTGKTTLPREVAAVTGRPMFKQSFRHDLEPDEWIASKEITDKGTEWKILEFIKSMHYPFYVVLDEFNRLIRGGRLWMNRGLDEGGTFQLPDGTEVTPHEHWRAIATDNTRGLGDGLDKFDGDVADISTTDRFGIMQEVPYLPVPEQQQLLKNWYPQLTDDMVKDIVSFGTRVVQGYKSGVFPLPWTPRRMKKAGKLTLRYRNPVRALKNVYYNFLAEDRQQQACNQCLIDVGLHTKYGDFNK